MAYQKFQARNFTDEDIYFLTQTVVHDLNGDGYDDGIVDDPAPTKEAVLTAISGWAAAQPANGPLYLYLVDHGAPQSFQVASGQILTAIQLKAALDAFQQATGRPVVVIIEACYSGSFVAPLTNPAYDRLVLTSVDAQHPAYLSTDGATSYSAFLLANLYQGKSISDGLDLTKGDLATIGLPYKNMAPQVEGTAALKGLKVGGDFALAGIFPELTNTTTAQTINANETLTLSTEASSLLGGLTVWTVIIPPDYTPPAVSGDFVSVVDELPRVVLVDEDPATKIMDGVYQGSYADFTVTGAYQVVFYAKDSENNLVRSTPVTITVNNGVDLPTTTTMPASTTTTIAPTSSSTTSTTTATEPSTTTQTSSTSTTTATSAAPTTTTSSSTATLSTTSTTMPGNASVTLTVGPGWGLFSSAIGFQAPALFSDSATYTSVWAWTNNSWAVFLPGEESPGAYAKSKGFSQLTAINPGDGFWVHANSTSSLTITGSPVYGSLTFGNGWHLLGLKSAQALLVTDLLAGAPGLVSAWTWENGAWAVYLANEATPGAYAQSKGFGTLNAIKPGEGFWVHR
jgi:hypothetical protein